MLNLFPEDDMPRIIVVGQLTLSQCLALASAHPDKLLRFCTCEEEVDDLGLEYAWGIPNGMWYATSRESMPMCLQSLLDKAEHDGITVGRPPDPVEQAA